MPNLPRFYWELSGEDQDDGFGNITGSALEIVNDGYQPCDACVRIKYTEETACTKPDSLNPDTPPFQHCQCWYDCHPCCKCGDFPVVIYGPPSPKERSMEETVTLRPEVQWFAEKMEMELRANDWKGGWQNEDTMALYHRFRKSSCP